MYCNDLQWACVKQQKAMNRAELNEAEIPCTRLDNKRDVLLCGPLGGRTCCVIKDTVGGKQCLPILSYLWSARKCNCRKATCVESSRHEVSQQTQEPA